MSLITTFVVLVQPLSAAMTVPTFANLLVLWTGWVFARRHTITGMLVSAGVAGTRHHAAFHRVFAAARWSLDELGLAVFGLMLGRWLPPPAPVSFRSNRGTDPPNQGGLAVAQ